MLAAIAVLVHLTTLAVGLPWAYVFAQLEFAKAQGVYVSPEEGMEALLDESGLTRSASSSSAQARTRAMGAPPMSGMSLAGPGSLVARTGHGDSAAGRSSCG